MTDCLQHIATGRRSALFSADIAAHEPALREALGGKRILAIGAAGSIGSNTVLEMARYTPRSLHLIDQNENDLAEIVRQFRTSRERYVIDDFRALPLDYGSRALKLFLNSVPVYDVVINFAAIKHVRSEKDPFSTMQMLDTNIVKQVRLMRWLAATGFSGRFFTVSTDKAANPSSMMGATKRLMEHVLFNSNAADALAGTKTTARFANVAFSNGSLLQSFQKRLARIEPLAAPRDTRRYFVSLKESGQLCTIAACLAPDRCITIPKLNPEDHLFSLEDIARRFLSENNYEAVVYDDEAAACRDARSLRARRQWPLLLTPLDTAGEKSYEEFMTDKEQAFEFGMPNLRAIQYREVDRNLIDEAIAKCNALVSLDASVDIVDKEKIKQIIGAVEPDFLVTHQDSARNLDQRI